MLGVGVFGVIKINGVIGNSVGVNSSVGVGFLVSNCNIVGVKVNVSVGGIEVKVGVSAGTLVASRAGAAVGLTAVSKVQAKSKTEQTGRTYIFFM